MSLKWNIKRSTKSIKTFISKLKSKRLRFYSFAWTFKICRPRPILKYVSYKTNVAKYLSQIIEFRSRPAYHREQIHKQMTILQFGEVLALKIKV